MFLGVLLYVGGVLFGRLQRKPHLYQPPSDLTSFDLSLAT